MNNTNHPIQKQTDVGKLINIEIILSYVLRIGVISCAVVIAFGVLLTWINPRALHYFTNEVLPALTMGNVVSDGEIPRSISQFISGVRALNPTVIIALGLFLLILLPIVRVALTVVLFFLERDYEYLVITLFVLMVLLSGLFFGKAL